MVQRIFPIRSMRIGWRLLLLTVLVFGTATYSSSAKSAEDAVAYVLMAKGKIAGHYKPSDRITLGSRIQLRPGDRLEVYHIGTCHWIRISGAISLKFRRASYQPKTAPEIVLLKTGCTPICRPKGDDSGMATRGVNTQKVSSTPNFLIHRDHLEFRQIELSETQNPSDKRVLDLSTDSSILRWPNGLAPLQRGKTYELRVLRSGKSIELEAIQITNSGDPEPASDLVVIDLSESK